MRQWALRSKIPCRHFRNRIAREVGIGNRAIVGRMAGVQSHASRVVGPPLRASLYDPNIPHASHPQGIP